MKKAVDFLEEMGISPNEKGAFMAIIGDNEINLRVFLEMYLEDVFEETIRQIKTRSKT